MGRVWVRRRVDALKHVVRGFVSRLITRAAACPGPPLPALRPHCMNAKDSHGKCFSKNISESGRQMLFCAELIWGYVMCSFGVSDGVCLSGCAPCKLRHRGSVRSCLLAALANGVIALFERRPQQRIFFFSFATSLGIVIEVNHRLAVVCVLFSLVLRRICPEQFNVCPF